MAKRPKPYTEKKHLTRRELRKILIGVSGSLAPLIKKKSLAQRVFKAVSFRIRKHFDLWSLAWAEFGLTRGYSWLKRGTGIVAFALFTGAGQSLYAVAHYVFPFLPWYGWFLTFFATTVLAQTFVIHYSGIAHERIRREKVEELEDEIWLLRGHLQPQLKVSYANGADDHVVTSHGNEVRHRTIRIRIENTGGRLIEGVKVKAETFLNFGDIPLYDTPLRIAHDLNNDKLNGFAISPGDRERADVVSKAYGSPDIYLCHALGKGFLAVTHTKDFPIKVRVTATDVPPQEVTLQMFLDENENLRCKTVA